MPNKPILITGCQRSGTTLLSLILDSHPRIRSIDEMDYRPRRFAEYLQQPDYHPNVAFKLPGYAHAVKSFADIPESRVIWCIRDPRDVVLSMVRLQLGFEQRTVSWVHHPLGADREIQRSLSGADKLSDKKLTAYLEKYRQINSKPPAARNHKESIFTGALCWTLKNRLLDEYKKDGVPYYILRYEDLLADSRGTVGSMLEFLGLPWHDNVLRHHQLHSGQSVGGTDNSRQIDVANKGKWKREFSREDLAIIRSLCSDVAQKHGYQLSG